MFIGADLNGHVGTYNRGDKRWHGGFGYGTRNEQGDEIVQLAKSHNLAILNTFFKTHTRHLITYSSGGRETQIDYHLCTSEIRKHVKDCKVILGEDAVDALGKNHGSGKEMQLKMQSQKRKQHSNCGPSVLLP